jgi:hypothetical protein
MSSLLDASGRQIRPKISDDELVRALTAMKMRLDALNTQIINMGIFTEYMFTRLEESEIDLKMDKFEEWAEARWKEIQEEAEQMRNAQVQEIKDLAAEQQVSESTEELVNLDDA